jgi:hypothetical protein
MQPASEHFLDLACADLGHGDVEFAPPITPRPGLLLPWRLAGSVSTDAKDSLILSDRREKARAAARARVGFRRAAGQTTPLLI